MKKHDWTEEQNDIITAQGSIVVSASAGTGKTYVITQKIEYEIQLKQTFQKIAALTFTNKAAEELSNRIKRNKDGHFWGTIHNFVIYEIINPFFKDLYSVKFEGDFSYSTRNEFNSFEAGIKILSESGEVGNYKDKKKSFIFELALKIIQSSKACQLFLRAKYFKIFIDEYQDCDTSMHKFFLYILEKLDIPLVIVGDEKQSIYSWRGANPELFKSLLVSDQFKKYELTVNFRSCASIQNYANLVFGYKTNSYKDSDEKGVLFLVVENSETSVLDGILNALNHDKEHESVAILTRKNNNVKNIGEFLNQNGINCAIIKKSPIENIQTKDSYIYLLIAKYLIVQGYSEYDFSKEIDLENSYIEVSFEELKKYLQQLYTENKNVRKKIVLSILKLFNLNLNEELYSKLEETINDEIYHYGFNIEEYNNVVMTIHASKGLEYDKVILFTDDFNFTGQSQDDREVHYVAATRAKSKLIIIAPKNNNSINFWKYLKSQAKLNGIELDKILKW